MMTQEKENHETKIQEKENDENTKFVKEPHDPTRDYILQKNKKTKLAVFIIISFLILLTIGLVISGVLFGDAS